jgi:hypothetical protein
MSEMSAVESYANGPVDAGVTPLDMTKWVAPASCFWAAANGAALGVITAVVTDRAVAYVYKHYGHGGFDADKAPVGAGVSDGLSGDQLVALRGGASLR